MSTAPPETTLSLPACSSVLKALHRSERRAERERRFTNRITGIGTKGSQLRRAVGREIKEGIVGEGTE